MYIIQNRIVILIIVLLLCVISTLSTVNSDRVESKPTPTPSSSSSSEPNPINDIYALSFNNREQVHQITTYSIEQGKATQTASCSECLIVVGLTDFNQQTNQVIALEYTFTSWDLIGIDINTGNITVLQSCPTPMQFVQVGPGARYSDTLNIAIIPILDSFNLTVVVVDYTEQSSINITTEYTYLPGFSVSGTFDINNNLYYLFYLSDDYYPYIAIFDILNNNYTKIQLSYDDGYFPSMHIVQVIYSSTTDIIYMLTWTDVFTLWTIDPIDGSAKPILNFPQLNMVNGIPWTLSADSRYLLVRTDLQNDNSGGSSASSSSSSSDSSSSTSSSSSSDDHKHQGPTQITFTTIDLVSLNIWNQTIIAEDIPSTTYLELLS